MDYSRTVVENHLYRTYVMSFLLARLREAGDEAADAMRKKG